MNICVMRAFTCLPLCFPSPPSAAAVFSRGLVQDVLSKEQQLYFEHVTSTLDSLFVLCVPRVYLITPRARCNIIMQQHLLLFLPPCTRRQAQHATIFTNNNNTRNHAGAIKCGDEAVQIVALRSVRQDQGLGALLPYFVQFVVDEVAFNLLNLPVLTSLMALAEALVSSPHLHVRTHARTHEPTVRTHARTQSAVLVVGCWWLLVVVCCWLLVVASKSPRRFAKCDAMAGVMVAGVIHYIK